MQTRLFDGISADNRRAASKFTSRKLLILLETKKPRIDRGLIFEKSKIGSGGGFRTPDPAINSRLLYH